MRENKLLIDQIDTEFKKEFGNIKEKLPKIKQKLEEEEYSEDWLKFKLRFKLNGIENEELFSILKRLNEVRVYKIDDFDTVVARSWGEAKEWYLNETGVYEEEIFSEDMDIEINKKGLNKNKIWFPINLKEVKDFFKKFLISSTFKYVKGELCTQLTYKQAIIMGHNQRLPYILCTTEW